MSAELSPEHDAFARYYVKYGKASIAYRKAIKPKPETTKESIWASASRLLSDVRVGVRVEHYRKLATQARDSTMEKIGEQLGLMAYLDKRDIYDDNGNLKPPHEWPEHIARAVSGIKVTEEKDIEGNVIGYTKEVKFESRTGALALLAKWKGMLIDRTEIGPVGAFDALSDDQIAKELAAERAALKAIEGADKSSKKSKA